MDPLLSIAIVNYNYGRFLENTIRSIVRQKTSEVELIVVDGASTDNSVEIIRRYEDDIDWWVSEPDKGQSDAFNKAFSHAHGKYLTWVNADDVLVPGCLDRVLRAMKRHSHCEWFTSNSFQFLETGEVYSIAWGPHWYPSFLQLRNGPLVAFGPSTFFSKKVFDRIGGIDPSLHFGMDTDIWIRFIASGVKQRRVNAFCWAFRMHADSKTAEFGERKLSKEDVERWHREFADSCRKVGYRPSRFVHGICLALRVLDGSLLRRLWLKKTFRHFSFE